MEFAGVVRLPKWLPQLANPESIQARCTRLQVSSEPFDREEDRREALRILQRY
jgi:hypothetical protein